MLCAGTTVLPPLCDRTQVVPTPINTVNTAASSIFISAHFRKLYNMFVGYVLRRELLDYRLACNESD